MQNAPPRNINRFRRVQDSPHPPATHGAAVFFSVFFLTGSLNNDFLGPAVAGVRPPQESLPLCRSTVQPLAPATDFGGLNVCTRTSKKMPCVSLDLGKFDDNFHQEKHPDRTARSEWARRGISEGGRGAAAGAA